MSLTYWRDEEGCYVTDYNTLVTRSIPCSQMPGSQQQPTTPQLPTISTPNASTGGVLIQSGASWYEDLLNTLLGLGAIGQGAAYIPSTNMGVSNVRPTGLGVSLEQQYALLRQRELEQRDTRSGVAEDLGGFVKRNSTWILLGGIAYVLWTSGRKK